MICKKGRDLESTPSNPSPRPSGHRPRIGVRGRLFAGMTVVGKGYDDSCVYRVLSRSLNSCLLLSPVVDQLHLPGAGEVGLIHVVEAQGREFARDEELQFELVGEE